MKVSACIPCHNNAVTLATAIASVRRQTRPVAELFVIDDGSADDSVQIARELGLRVLVHPKSLGRGAVRVRSVFEAKHELMLSCDATMALPPTFLERALPWFEDPAVAAVMGRIVPSTGHTAVDRWRGRHLFKADAPAVVNERACLATGGVLLRLPLVRQAGNFNAQYREGEDAELGRRLLARGHKVVFDPALEVRPLTRNSLGQLLERYWRWNIAPAGGLARHDYWRQIVYSLKVMARRDLQQGDWGAALISLLCPHYLLWKSLSPHHRARSEG